MFYLLTDISDILKESPNQRDVLNLLVGISSKWYDIGLSLGIDDNDLDELSRNVQYTNATKLSKVIRKWIDTKSSPVTWETVISAIEGPIVDNKNKADEIRDYLTTSKYRSYLS